MAGEVLAGEADIPTSLPGIVSAVADFFLGEDRGSEDSFTVVTAAIFLLVGDAGAGGGGRSEFCLDVVILLVGNDGSSSAAASDGFGEPVLSLKSGDEKECGSVGVSPVVDVSVIPTSLLLVEAIASVRVVVSTLQNLSGPLRGDAVSILGDAPGRLTSLMSLVLLTLKKELGREASNSLTVVVGAAPAGSWFRQMKTFRRTLGVLLLLQVLSKADAACDERSKGRGGIR